MEGRYWFRRRGLWWKAIRKEGRAVELTFTVVCLVTPLVRGTRFDPGIGILIAWMVLCFVGLYVVVFRMSEPISK
jgi:hypothetical protein